MQLTITPKSLPTWLSLKYKCLQALFVAGKPFYEDKEVVVSEEEDCEAVTVLNECNMDQYKALAGEWVGCRGVWSY